MRCQGPEIKGSCNGSFLGVRGSFRTSPKICRSGLSQFDRRILSVIYVDLPSTSLVQDCRTEPHESTGRVLCRVGVRVRIRETAIGIGLEFEDVDQDND